MSAAILGSRVAGVNNLRASSDFHFLCGPAGNRSKLVAILLPTIANPICADTVQSLMDGLTSSGYQTLLGLTAYSTAREEALVEAILGRRPDGIVLAGTRHTDATVDRLSKAKIPVVA